MLGKKGMLFVIVLFLAAVLVTGEVRLHLDRITESFRNDFRQMVYLPRGNALKIVACGFEAPLADALFIKGLVYYAESLDGINKDTRAYSYALFDVITDLSPRFFRAYQIGGNMLAGSSDLDANLDSATLIDKGIKFWDDLEKNGEHMYDDPRWLLHVSQAINYRLGIQSKLLLAGDVEGAAEARAKSAAEFQLAAKSPYAPPIVRMASIGFETVAKGRGGVLEATTAVIEVLQELYDTAEARGDKAVAEDISHQLKTNTELLNKIRETRGAELFFSRVGREFFAKEGRPAESLDDLLESGLLRKIPDSLPLDMEKTADLLLAMPDGTFLSRRLAQLESAQFISSMTDAASVYRRAHGNPPENPQLLLSDKLLDSIPTPPLAAIGQKFEYDSETGRFTNVMPYRLDLPPEYEDESVARARSRAANSNQ